MMAYLHESLFRKSFSWFNLLAIMVAVAFIDSLELPTVAHIIALVCSGIGISIWADKLAEEYDRRSEIESVVAVLLDNLDSVYRNGDGEVQNAPEASENVTLCLERLADLVRMDDPHDD